MSDGRQLISCDATAVPVDVPPAVRDYCHAILSAASKSHFMLWWIEPTEIMPRGCYMFRVPGGVMRHGVHSEHKVASLLSACNLVRGELEARGHVLPDYIGLEG